MNIVKNDRVMLVKPMDSMQNVGEVYEIANFTDTVVILRKVDTKVAVASVEHDEFWKYFKKVEDVKNWTKWNVFINASGETIGSYRTNGKKVQVRTIDGYISEASCNVKHNDIFDLNIGLMLAYNRCMIKRINDLIASDMMIIENYEYQIKELKKIKDIANSYIKQIIDKIKQPEQQGVDANDIKS